ncbi:MAG: hypothetical protein MR022_02545 [Ruminococcus sp.]|nr:hypothetical protein [Ruminococcus sp.]
MYIAYGGFDSNYDFDLFVKLSQLDRSHVSARKLANSYQRFQLYIAYGGFDSSYYLRAFIELSQLDRVHVSARKLAHSYHAFSCTSLTAALIQTMILIYLLS